LRYHLLLPEIEVLTVENIHPTRKKVRNVCGATRAGVASLPLIIPVLTEVLYTRHLHQLLHC